MKTPEQKESCHNYIDAAQYHLQAFSEKRLNLTPAQRDLLDQAREKLLLLTTDIANEQ